VEAIGTPPFPAPTAPTAPDDDGDGERSKKKISRAKLADVAPSMLARQAMSTCSNFTTEFTNSAFIDDLDSRTPLDVMNKVEVGFLSLRTHDSADGMSRVRMAADGEPMSWHMPPDSLPGGGGGGSFPIRSSVPGDKCNGKNVDTVGTGGNEIYGNSFSSTSKPLWNEVTCC
jgi:hypothetical protein